MHKNKIIYLIITLLFVIISIFIISNTGLKDSVHLSIAIQIILILYLLRLVYGCVLYIRKQYTEHKYSYSIVITLEKLNC